MFSAYSEESDIVVEYKMERGYPDNQGVLINGEGEN